MRQKALEVMDAVFTDDNHDLGPPLITLHNDNDNDGHNYTLSSSLSSDEPSPDQQLALVSMQGLLASVQGEKDPRCLVLSLRIIRRALHIFASPLSSAMNDRGQKGVSSTSSSSSSSSLLASNEDGDVGVLMERVFESLACYFPITFTPPEDDPHGITPQQLQRALFEALVAHR